MVGRWDRAEQGQVRGAHALSLLPVSSSYKSEAGVWRRISATEQEQAEAQGMRHSVLLRDIILDEEQLENEVQVRETERQRERQRHRDRQRERQRERQRDRATERQTRRDRHAERKRQRDRETERQRDRETERQRDRQRERTFNSATHFPIRK
eukprot:COSAG03_NODE_2312_length_2894_cov_3.837925_1_plen_153_part_00